MNMSTKTFRLFKDDLEALKVAAAASGKDEKEILHDLLTKATPEEVRNELIRLAKARTPTRKSRDTETAEVATVTPSHTAEIGSRLKNVIADAVETKVYLKTLGINLGDEPKQQYPYPPWMMPPQMQQPPKPEKDIKEWVMELKAIESLEKDETNPAILAVVKEMKESVVKAIEQNKQPEKKETSIEDMMKWMAMYRMMGQPEEAQKMQQQITQKMDELNEKLHVAQREMDQKEAEWRHDDLTRQINELKNAPTQFDQIIQISQLSDQDPAIKAYVYKKLGIKEKGEPLTPEKLGDYIKQIKVPLGDILGGIGDILFKRAQQVKQPPPPEATAPPPGVITTETPEEAEIASRALGFQQPANPPVNPEPKPPEPPAESGLPPESGTEGGQPPKKPSRKGAK